MNQRMAGLNCGRAGEPAKPLRWFILFSKEIGGVRGRYTAPRPWLRALLEISWLENEPFSIPMKRAAGRT
jgi:hypothetical protein